VINREQRLPGFGFREEAFSLTKHDISLALCMASFIEFKTFSLIFNVIFSLIILKI
jgi:hypothetical protein